MLTPGKYYVNTSMRLTMAFEDENGNDVDPTTVTFKTMSPGGAETTYVYLTSAALLRASEGHYTVDIVPDEAGRWFFRWVTTGTGTTIAIEGDFLVQDSPFFQSAVGYAL